MSNSNKIDAEVKPTRESRLWDDSGRHTRSLGCFRCRDEQLCGGLHVEAHLFDCLGNCCGKPDECDYVCRNNPRIFVDSRRETDGFKLQGVPRAARLTCPTIPRVIPILHHRYALAGEFSPRAVSLRLYDIAQRITEFNEPADLASAYGFEAGTPVVLTGVAQDPELERWWARDPLHRREIIRKLRALDIKLVTTPNYSVFSDAPRWDNLHAIKRIAITHEEFLREGIPAALHVNARTDHDWERWFDYIQARNEVTHLACEFGTGAGRAKRINWHTDHLSRLASSVGRPLHLTIRSLGPTKVEIYSKLNASFDEITFLDSNAFFKTINRYKASHLNFTDNSPEWESIDTPQGAPLDELMTHNWCLVRESFERTLT